MDYEKKYKEALEWARKVMQGKTGFVLDEVLEKFPELKESKDEKIKKEILDYIIKGSESCYDVQQYGRERFEKWIAWLEKQVEIDKISYEIAEKEKREFVGDGFIKCYSDFQDFKEGETYWLEYVGNDNYNVRSDNLLGKTYHITPGQLYTVFKKQTWLEKQGEQKQDVSMQINPSEYINDMGGNGCYLKNTAQNPTDNDKIEQKFHEGDWIVDKENKEVFYISKNLANTYEIVDIEGNDYHVPHYTLEEDYDVWTIQDAKDGDVLTNGEIILIFKQFEEPAYRQHIIAYVGLDTSSNIQVTDGCWQLGIDKASPATKEQRGLLFQKMHEAGYEWNADKKELKKIELAKGEDYGIDGLWHAQQILEKTFGEVEGYQSDDGILSHECAISAVKELYKQKHNTWNKEDEEMIKYFDELLDYAFKNWSKFGGNAVNALNWLEALKDRVQPQPKQEWSEEDEEMHRKCICAMRASACGFPEEEKFVEQVNNWLNSLKGKVQPKQEWSEEDIEHFRRCLGYIEAYVEPRRDDVRWFKSLRHRNRWKPSEEQIKVLNEVLNFAANHESPYWNDYIFGTLNNLKRQLKKLREE